MIIVSDLESRSLSTNSRSSCMCLMFHLGANLSAGFAVDVRSRDGHETLMFETKARRLQLGLET